MKTIIILCGIPCSGKSTYAESKKDYKIISRDIIREELFGKNYKQNPHSEKRVTDVFNYQVLLNIEHSNIILDNCHCKEGYLINLVSKYKDYIIQIIFFDCSLIKAYYRNYIRYFKTGKWIPMKVIYNMYKNYNKINKQKYEKTMLCI